MVWAIVCEGSPGGRSEITGGRICKQVGFKPGMKERELWMSRVVNQKRKKE